MKKRFNAFLLLLLAILPAGCLATAPPVHTSSSFDNALELTTGMNYGIRVMSDSAELEDAVGMAAEQHFSPLLPIKPQGERRGSIDISYLDIHRDHEYRHGFQPQIGIAYGSRYGSHYGGGVRGYSHAPPKIPMLVMIRDQEGKLLWRAVYRSGYPGRPPEQRLESARRAIEIIAARLKEEMGPFAGFDSP